MRIGRSLKSTTARSLASLLAVSSMLLAAQPYADAEKLAKPDFQIKLQLNDTVIDDAGHPTEEFAAFAHLGPKEDEEESVYVDTPEWAYSAQGWSIRFRHKQGSSSYDVTYKWRDKLDDNSLSATTIDTGLARAVTKGFGAEDTNYEPQVNASYNTSTLDFSTKKKNECKSHGCTIPSRDVILQIVRDREPGKLQKARGESPSKANLQITDIVRQETWEVEINGIRADLEVSTIGSQRWVEISEKETSRKDTVEKRSKLIAALREAGYLKLTDAFKTRAALETLH